MDTENQLRKKVRVLNERLWSGRIGWPDVERWLDNFDDGHGSGEAERLHALYLLSQFIYFSEEEIRELLRAVYRDLYRYPIVEQIRKNHGDTLDPAVIDPELEAELAATRFLGIGNPSESGAHLLYYLRQENKIPNNRFMSVSGLFNGDMASPGVGLADPSIRRLVFIDDFCGAGSQAIRYSKEPLRALRAIEKRTGTRPHVSYLVVAALGDGLKEIRDKTSFDQVEAVFKLDESYRAVSPGSRHFPVELPEGISLSEARALALKYGKWLDPDQPLGFDAGELLLGFNHNVPDNTLPIIWWNEPTPPWQPIFKRHHKVYGV